MDDLERIERARDVTAGLEFERSQQRTWHDDEPEELEPEEWLEAQGNAP